MSIAENTPDGTFVNAVAALVHPTSRVHQIFRKEVLVVGDKITEFDDPAEPSPDPIKVSTLGAVRDYIQAGLADEGVVVVVKSPTCVEILAPIVGDMRQKFVYLVASPSLPSITFGQYLGMEQFLIQLQSCFMPSDSRDKLQTFAGRLKTGLASEIEDDGISQTVAVKAGLTRNDSAKVVNPWPLAPFRTFAEILPPESPYVLRLKQVNTGDTLSAMAALFEADGGAWQHRAIDSIKDWLRAELGEDVIILA